MPVAESLNVILLLTAAIYVAVCAGVGLSLGATFKRPMLGFWLGFWLGLVGLFFFGWAHAKGWFDEQPAKAPTTPPNDPKKDPTWWQDKE